ncbi:MAG TPA: hypothetical protein PLT20_12555, partial [Sedimentisphaerales bacterium]|nr:hypothetical protein [Sedimentisphaerales bacterium]
VQIHGGKDNLVDGNVFIDCFAGISFSRWGEKRWLESIEPFLSQASETLYSTRYPELANLKTGADVNLIARNFFAHCGVTFLRDGGLQKSALNIVTDESLDAEAACRQLPLASPIPVEEMGPYEHPWRQVDVR